jgi:hypothetical protein
MFSGFAFRYMQRKIFGGNSSDLIFALPIFNEWEFSSAGSEHLPYKQRVGGSIPSTPTMTIKGFSRGPFLLNRVEIKTVLA